MLNFGLTYLKFSSDAVFHIYDSFSINLKSFEKSQLSGTSLLSKTTKQEKMRLMHYYDI